MILSGNQPYFVPYLGYWQLINNCDVFVICDDYHYIKGGWINRNRILNGSGATYLNLSLEKASQNKLINETFIKDLDFEKQLRSIECSYHKSPNFSEGYKLMEEIFACKESNLSDFLSNSIKIVANYLDINTRFVKSSSLEGNSQFKCEYRIYDFCNRMGADTYVNAIGGTGLYDFDEFKQRNITLQFMKTNEISYKQFESQFVENLSILDVIMFNSKEKVKKLLGEFTLIGHP